MRRLLAEPLLHFFLLGTALFAAYALILKAPPSEARLILVTQARIDSLGATFARVWQRPPTGDELEGLIQDYIREEVYYRAAVARGLDRDDSVVRRRMHQKLEFISEDVTASAEPTDDELVGFAASRGDDFRIDRRVSFQQVFLDRGHRGEALAADAAALLAVLEGGGDQADHAVFGDPTSLERSFADLSFGEATRLFGLPFSSRLRVLRVGRWEGPIESRHGAHLVRVDRRSEGRLPPLADIREPVRRAWGDARRSEASDRFYRTLLEGYTVTIEGRR